MNGYIRQAYTCDDKNYVLLEVDELPNRTEELQEIIIRKPSLRKKRSLDANGYHWVLCGKIGKVIKSDADSVHYDLMLRYGTPWEDNQGYPVIAALPISADIRKMDVYGRLIYQADGINHYLLIKPSRFYDTAEMARLIEGTIDEAKLLRIETLTPRELEEMGIGKEQYESV